LPPLVGGGADYEVLSERYMTMWIKLLSPLILPFLRGVGRLAIKLLPVERVIAWLLNKWLAQVSDENFCRFSKSARHIVELADLLTEIMADKRITPEEATTSRERIMRIREMLLEDWAHGKPSKGLEEMLLK
jgi:hypothetical protein